MRFSGDAVMAEMRSRGRFRYSLGSLMLVVTGMALLFAMLRTAGFGFAVFIVFCVVPMVLARFAFVASNRCIHQTRGFARRSAVIVAMVASAITIVVGCVAIAAGIVVQLLA